MLDKGTLHSLLGLCALGELKAQGCQEEAVSLQSALGATGFHLLAMSVLELSLEPKSLTKA